MTSEIPMAIAPTSVAAIREIRVPQRTTGWLGSRIRKRMSLMSLCPYFENVKEHHAARDTCDKHISNNLGCRTVHQTSLGCTLFDFAAEPGMPSLLGLPFFGVMSFTFVGRPILPKSLRNGSGSSSSTLTIVFGFQMPLATSIAAATGGTPAVYEMACDSTSL